MNLIFFNSINKQLHIYLFMVTVPKYRIVIPIDMYFFPGIRTTFGMAQQALTLSRLSVKIKSSLMGFITEIASSAQMSLK